MGDRVTDIKEKNIDTKKVFTWIGLAVLFCAAGVISGVTYASSAAAGGGYSHLKIVVFAIVLASIAIAAVLLYVEKCSVKPEILYAIVGLCFGFIYLLMIPVGVVPDEPSHMYMAYDLSNHMLGIEDDNCTNVLARAADVDFPLVSKQLSMDYYNTYYDSFFDMAGDTTLKETGYSLTSSLRYLYFLPALGITIGRLLGLGTLMTLFLGRIFNTLFFVWAVYYSIKKMPFGKSVMFVWALLPIVLQQVNSYSYDNCVLAFSALITSLTLKFMYSGEKAKKTEIIIYAIAVLLLIPCKGHALLPISAFALVLVARYIKGRREDIRSFYEAHKKAVKLTVIIGGVIVLAAVLIIGVQAVKYLTAPERINTNYISYADHTGYTIGYFIKNPKQLVLMMFQTFLGQGETYIRQMLGDSLGWLEIPISGLCLFAYIILFVFAALRRENEKVYIGYGTKAYMWILSASACLLAVMAMLLRWTPNDQYIVAGVQGRYFLPALPMALLACRSKGSCTKADADRTVMFFAVYIQLLVIVSFFRNFG